MRTRVAITGVGVLTSIGVGVDDFAKGLKQGKSGVRKLEGKIPFVATVPQFDLKGQDMRVRKILSPAPRSTQLSGLAALEAWRMAGLEGRMNSLRIGIIVGGCNLHRATGVSPRYGLNFWDSHQAGCLSELLGVRGMSYTVGASSASGNVAMHQARLWIQSGELDACVVVGAFSELSETELHGLEVLGAINTDSACAVEKASCPFDRCHRGFVPGEGSGAVVLEKLESAPKEKIWGELAGSAVVMDANHLPNPSENSEKHCMALALETAGTMAEKVDYVNAHATSTPMGDCAEARAIKEIFGDQPWVNSTKGMTGHCLGGASVLEAIATLIQMRNGFVHPNINLTDPEITGLRYVGNIPIEASLEICLSNAYGFGGFNSTIVLAKGELE